LERGCDKGKLNQFPIDRQDVFKLMVPALCLCFNSNRGFFWCLPAVLRLFLMMDTLKPHPFGGGRLYSKCEAMSKSPVLKALKSHFFRVNNLAFERCLSMGGRQSSDYGINLCLKPGGDRARDIAEDNIGSIISN
jgi:hypothetical protein